MHKPEIKVPGLIEACGLILAAGALLLVIGSSFHWGSIPPTASDPPWWAGLLITTATAAAVVMVWGLIGVSAFVIRSTAPARHQAMSRSPVEIHVSIARRIGLPAPDAPLGFLDYQVAWERAVDPLTADIQRLTKVQQKGLAINQNYLPRMTALIGSPAEIQLPVVREYGKKVDGITSQLEKLEPRVRNSSRQLAENLVARVKSAPSTQDLASFAPLVDRLTEAVPDSLRAMEHYRETIAALRRLNVQQAVNRATDRLTPVVDRLIEDFRLVLDAGAEVRAEIGRRTGPKPVSPKSNGRSRNRRIRS